MVTFGTECGLEELFDSLLAIVDSLLLSKTADHVLGLSIGVFSLALPDRASTNNHHTGFYLLFPIDSIVSL